MEQAIKTFVTTLDSRNAFLSCIVDRGKEFSCWEKIERYLNIPMYFCDPYSPWQRGFNENGNGFLENFSQKRLIFQKLLSKKK